MPTRSTFGEEEDRETTPNPVATQARPVSEITRSNDVPISTPTLDDTLAEARRAMTSWRIRRRYSIGISASMFPITLALMLALPPATHSPLPLIIGFPIMLSSLFGLLFAVLARPRNQGSLQYLWQSNDVSAIGPLLESVRLLLPEVTKRADSALLRLLPRIETEHIDLLTPYQRRRLRAYVGAERDLEPNYSALKLEGIGAGQIEAARAAHKQRAECRRSSALAVVRALLIAGTNEDIPLVARLADGHGVAFEDVELIGEANACLCELLSRREIRERDATYLRAALKPAASGDTLLRAGTSQTETRPEYLLKAASPPFNPSKP